MTVFYHIGDYGPTGWKALPAAVLTTEKISLWAPSFQQLREAATVMEPRHVIELVEMGKIQILGREEWFVKRQRMSMKSRWPGASWDDADEELQRISHSDATLALEKRRVRIMGPGEGAEWASNVDEDCREYKEAKARYEGRKLPEGNLRKADLYKKRGDDPVRSVLRDVKDHSKAMESCGAWASLMGPDYPDTVDSILGLSQPPIQESTRNLDIGRLTELIEFATQISTIKSGADLIDRVKKSEHIDFTREIKMLLQSSNMDIPNQILMEIEKAFKKSGLEPKTLISMRIWPASLSLLALSISATAADVVLCAAGLLPLTWDYGKRSLERVSMLPARYDGPIIPFLWLQGVTNPKRRQIEDAIQRIKRALRESSNNPSS